MLEFTSFQMIFFILLSLITLVLSIYLGVLFVRLHYQKKQQTQIKQQFQAQYDKKEKFYRDSLKIICQATLAKQCELSEACLRINHLLGFFPQKRSNENYRIIFDMYEQIKGFDILEDRLSLSKQAKFNQDKERIAIENKFSSKMYKALEILSCDLNSCW